MLDNLADYVPINVVLYVLIVIVSLGFIIIDLAPKVESWMVKWRNKTNAIEDMSEDVSQNSSDVEEMNERLNRDYDRLNALEKTVKSQQRFLDDSLEERELILRSLLGLAQGLQELGANGPTKKVEKDIHEYLLQIAHKAR